MSNKILEVQNIKVNVIKLNDNDYICISDFVNVKKIEIWYNMQLVKKLNNFGIFRYLGIIQILIPSNSTVLEKILVFILLQLVWLSGVKNMVELTLNLHLP